MRIKGIAALFIMDGTMVLGGKVRGEELAALPWKELTDELQSSTVFKDTSPIDFVAECVPEFLKIFDNIRPTQHNLVDQPSGLCMNQLYCAFKSCNPMANEENKTLQERWDTYLPSGTEQNRQKWLNANNTSYNLPSQVLFPKFAGDAAAAVAFAKEYNVEISIKNSGHNYAGASTKKDTLLLNMNQYKPYASDDGPIECEALQSTEMQNDLSNQACMLALARGKPATIRVGGGENFDKVYRALKAFNEKQPDGYKYHMVGGAAGTVSPMGWSWQGGLGGTTAGRMYGFGVDQVLQIEMILPNGHHVRFGPTAWEDDSSFLYPKTTQVSGVCNDNPSEEDESMWTWKACPEDIDFAGLWYAVRGGGGGTWGVVLSAHLQLHDYLPIEVVPFPNTYFPSPSCGIDAPEALLRASWGFMIDFLLNPSALSLSDEESNSCGAPSNSPPLLFCYGEGSGDVFASAWKKFLINKNQTLYSEGVPYEMIDKLLTGVCALPVSKIFRDYTDGIVATTGEFAGKANDAPPPGLPSSTENVYNVLVPKKWVLENRDAAIDNLFMYGEYAYYAFGGNTAISYDQSSSLSDGHREAGFMFYMTQGDATDMFYRDLFPGMYDVTASDFPGFIGSNHAGPNHLGPLKSNWTKGCPLDWTQKERESKCIPQQEAIYGSVTLVRLEAIKEAIDPMHMFNCNKCIGNNREPDNTGNIQELTGNIQELDKSGSGRLDFWGSSTNLLCVSLATLIALWF